MVLIPQGAGVVGQYDAHAAFGQSRALLVWNRLIMPNGPSIVLERQPGADPEFYAGLADQADDHFGYCSRRNPLDPAQRRLRGRHQRHRKLPRPGDPPGCPKILARSASRWSADH